MRGGTESINFDALISNLNTREAEIAKNASSKKWGGAGKNTKKNRFFIFENDADWWSDDPKWTPKWATSGYRSRFSDPMPNRTDIQNQPGDPKKWKTSMFFTPQGHMADFEKKTLMANCVVSGVRAVRTKLLTNKLISSVAN